MGLKLGMRASGAEAFTEPSHVIDERLRRAVSAEAIQIVRGVEPNGEIALLLLMHLGEGDAVFGFGLDDAEWFAGQIVETVALMRRT